jgi:N-methylhydantoinase A/oxoprolinase/acetone carboxylase beta subunit
MQRSDTVNPQKVETTFAGLEEKALARLRADGLEEKAINIRKIIDCRYIDQGYELRVPAPLGSVNETWGARTATAFHQSHEREYGHQFEDQEVQIVNLRVIGVGQIKELCLKELPISGVSPKAAFTGRREVCFSENNALQKLSTPCYNRSMLQASNTIAGPAIVEQEDSTTVINPGSTASVDRYGNLVIR